MRKVYSGKGKEPSPFLGDVRVFGVGIPATLILLISHHQRDRCHKYQESLHAWQFLQGVNFSDLHWYNFNIYLIILVEYGSNIVRPVKYCRVEVHVILCECENI